jgi:hypothetical protein
LQNGADAAALAVAQSCAAAGAAGGAAGGSCAGSAALAREFAGANANDGAAGVLTPVFPTASSVTVTAVTEEPDQAGAGVHTALRHPFAALLGISSTTVAAKAAAAWGSPRIAEAALPLAVSYCDFRPALDGTLQLIRFDQNTSCRSPRSGNALIPGGFGWLDQVPGECGLVVDIDGARVPSRPGSAAPNDCDTTFGALAGTTILVPVFNRVAGAGSTASYGLQAFAAFTVTGWRFSDAGSLPLVSPDETAPPCPVTCRGLQGHFVRWVSLKDAVIARGNPNLGAVVVSLSN